MSVLYKTDNDYPSYLNQVLDWADICRVSLSDNLPVGFLEYKDGIFDLSTRKIVSTYSISSDRRADLKIRFRFKQRVYNSVKHRGEKTIRLKDPNRLLYYIEGLRLWVLCTTENAPMTLDEVLDIPIADSRDLVALD